MSDDKSSEESEMSQISEAIKILAASNDGDETITIRIKDLCDVLHDAIGDVRRWDIVCTSRLSVTHADPDGQWMRAEDVDRLESQIATSLIDERVIE